MNKHVLAFLLSVSSLFVFVAQSNAQSRLIHYWNFNTATVPGATYTPSIIQVHADYSILDTSKARIWYAENPGVSTAYYTYLDFYVPTTSEYDTVNLRRSDTGGIAFKARNPSDSMELRFYIPTTHYKNIVFKYACERTTNGAVYQHYDYSIDSGASWRTSGLTTTLDSPTYNQFGLFTEYFSDTQVNNNPKLVFRVKFSGGLISTTSGNNRFDDVTVEGDTLIACTTPIAGTISGPSVVCIGSSVTLSTSGTGGSWSHTGTATTLSGSTVTGSSTGVDTIKYTVTNSCGRAVAVYPVMVSNPPTAGTVTGAYNVCQGVTTTFTDATTGGTWSSSNTAVATVDTTGVAGGVSGGSAIITYSVTNSCGTATAIHTLTVNPLPATGTITGTTTFCQGSTSTLADATTGGTWSSSSTGVATVVSSTGVVTGVSGGTATISYTTTNSCGNASATVTVTITPLPTSGTISGPSVVCIGDSIALTDGVTGGTWNSLTTSVAFVNPSSGVVLGLAPGADSITYNVTGACGSNHAAHAVQVLTTAQCLALSVPATAQGTTVVSVYPNPSNGQFTVVAPVSQDKTTITVTDIYGKVLVTRTVENAGSIKEDFDLSKATPGTYFIKVDTNGQTSRQKVSIF